MAILGKIGVTVVLKMQSGERDRVWILGDMLELPDYPNLRHPTFRLYYMTLKKQKQTHTVWDVEVF